MSNQCDNGYFDWRPGAWVKCEATQEHGQIQPYEGKRIRVDLGPGIVLFASSELLRRLGWEPM